MTKESYTLLVVVVIASFYHTETNLDAKLQIKDLKTKDVTDYY